MTKKTVIEGRSEEQQESVKFPLAPCMACEAIERDTSADARHLLGIAMRCRCGCVSDDTIAELARYAMADALLALDTRRGSKSGEYRLY